MPKTVTRDYHSLRRNLKLNDKYISNDGGDEGITIDDAGDVGINIPTTITPSTKLEVFNTNVQYSTGTAYQSSAAIVGSGTTFTAAMVGGRFVFDDGTDAGIITGFGVSTVITVSTSQTVGASDDLRAYKIYYPSVQVDTGASSTSLKIGSTSLDVSSGDFTLDVVGDINIDAGGGDVLFKVGGTSLFEFDLDSAFTIKSDEDTDDYFKITVGDNGTTNITTNDDAGVGANILLDVDGFLEMRGTYLVMSADTRTASGTGDFSFYTTETLNLGSGEAGGSDTHYGLRYQQTQTDLTGWNDVYLMHLYGGDAARTFAVRADGKVGIGVTDPDTLLEIFGTSTQLKLSYNADDYATFTVADTGDLTIATVGDGTTDSDLTLDADGDINLDAAGGDVNILQADLNIHATNKLYLDTGNDTYIYEISADNVKHIVGGDTVMGLSEAGNDGNLVDIGTSCAGFTQHEPTYNATDTIVYFNRLGNKAHLTFTSASETIVDIHLTFPNVSCNCQILIKQHASGGGAITNWKTFDQAGGNESTVVWAGGSAPTLTTGGSKIDIMSFYWDNDNHKAYGVASLNF